MNHSSIPKRAENINLKNLVAKIFKILRGLRFIRNKAAVLQHILGIFEKGPSVYCLQNQMKLQTNKTKNDITTLLSLYEIFDQEIYFTPVSFEKKIILDIGANIGVFSLYAAMKNKNTTVYAFEPDPDNFKQLCDNIQINKFDNVIIPFQKAVSQKKSPVYLYKDNVSARGHSLIYRAENKTKVESTTLESIFENLNIRKCDMLKMDIEGAEYETFYNCPDRVLDTIDLITLECHNGLTPIDPCFDREGMKTFLMSKGFQIIQGKKSILRMEKPKL